MARRARFVEERRLGSGAQIDDLVVLA